MLTYTLKKSPGMPLYEALYRCIRADILSGNLQPGQKLPSKRALAEHLELGKTTVEAAYAQLLSEGYITSKEKVGFFVETVEKPAAPQLPAAAAEPQQAELLLDLTSNGTEQFPFTVWSRLQREVILDYDRKLLLPMPHQGIPELREAIAAHLAQFRGMTVDPGNILIGAGTDFLYNLLIQLLGQSRIYAVEEPGYGKIRKIYAAGGVQCIGARMDAQGVIPGALGDADVLHISPSHHFPTGLVTPLPRRRALLDWAEAGQRWIIEDDYDSEFRFTAHPLPTMQAMAPERVIYMNSFSKSLAPSIRISYMILPAALMQEYRARLGFYDCTVPSFEQYTLSRFLSRGHFEQHINRMRRFYQRRRNRLISLLEHSAFSGKLTIQEMDAGLHFLLRVDTQWTDRRLTGWLEQLGIRMQSLSSFYNEGSEDLHCLIVNYSGLDEDRLPEALKRIEEELTSVRQD